MTLDWLARILRVRREGPMYFSTIDKEIAMKEPLKAVLTFEISDADGKRRYSELINYEYLNGESLAELEADLLKAKSDMHAAWMARQG